jgi:hypothetical protein
MLHLCKVSLHRIEKVLHLWLVESLNLDSGGVYDEHGGVNDVHSGQCYFVA